MFIGSGNFCFRLNAGERDCRSRHLRPDHRRCRRSRNCLFRKPGGAQGSPHYVSAKNQNLYVSLPMLDLKHKNLSSNQSDCGTLRSTSTLRSKAGGSSIYSTTKHSDYETATIKRSHSHRNSSLIAGAMRADLDSDQLFT